MSTIDLLLRGAAIGVTLLTAAVMLRRPAHRRQSLAFVAAAICISCYLLIATPAVVAALADVRPMLRVGAGVAPVFITWMVLEVFYDSPFRRWIWLVLAGVVAVLSLSASLHSWVPLLRGVLALLLYGGLIWVALTTASGDLVEKRRTFRRGFMAVLALTGCLITTAEFGFGDAPLPGWVFPVQAASFLAIAVLTSAWAVDASPEIWPEPAAERPANNAENSLAARLHGAMENGMWRQEGLTVRALAAEMNLPEHRLRTLINRELGHRNFSTFINGYRIAAAKEALTETSGTQKTILEIAFDCGFASLGPFNRAFRAVTGQSPTEFRERARRS